MSSSTPTPRASLSRSWMRAGSWRTSSAIRLRRVRSALCLAGTSPCRISWPTTRVECPQPAQEWHTDGGSKYGPELNYLQVFYYPQDCPRDMGPTELLPGSHFLYLPQHQLARYGAIKGSHYAVAPAGSIFLTVYSIWHRRSVSPGHGDSEQPQVQLLEDHAAGEGLGNGPGFRPSDG